ncbi:hypothetical protein TNCV_2505471 [Trichonephila clavipes]|uniref:Uncharacterized protein n=1 Tax=Trichonephila clavipes TaxID=2585209 RepID=A0A8X6WH49_TRICX|nr:hypothetical protein TNCV_2505471 [Trichonephila clavipes]
MMSLHWYQGSNLQLNNANSKHSGAMAALNLSRLQVFTLVRCESLENGGPTRVCRPQRDSKSPMPLEILINATLKTTK